MKFSSVLLLMLMLSACNYYGAIFDWRNKSEDKHKQIDIKESPMSTTKAYEVSATRITNKMLDDSADIYEAKPNIKLYIKRIQKNSDVLPDGLYNAQKTIKEIINGSGTYTIVDKIESADFILASKVSELKNDNQLIVLFSMDILNRQEEPVKSWSVTIRQMPEDKSWW